MKAMTPSILTRKKKFSTEDGREIVLITGAGGGIGFELAKQFHVQGAVVILWDIDGVRNQRAAQYLNDLDSGRAFAYTVDVSSKDEIYAAAQQVQTEVGHVTILVNNAGIMYGKQLLDSSDQMLNNTMQVNTMAHFWTVKAFLPQMVEMNRGHIVGVTSFASWAYFCNLIDYCTSKHAAYGFYESLDLELRELESEVKTTIVCTFMVKTPMTMGMPNNKYTQLLRKISLEPDFVAAEIIDAIQCDQPVKFIPKWMYVLYVLFKCLYEYLRTMESEDVFPHLFATRAALLFVFKFLRTIPQ